MRRRLRGNSRICAFARLARTLLEERIPWVNPEIERDRLEALARLEMVQEFCGIP